jgi:hypothetical protein
VSSGNGITRCGERSWRSDALSVAIESARAAIRQAPTMIVAIASHAMVMRTRIMMG